MFTLRGEAGLIDFLLAASFPSLKYVKGASPMVRSKELKESGRSESCECPVSLGTWEKGR